MTLELVIPRNEVERQVARLSISRRASSRPEAAALAVGFATPVECLMRSRWLVPRLMAPAEAMAADRRQVQRPTLRSVRVVVGIGGAELGTVPGALDALWSAWTATESGAEHAEQPGAADASVIALILGDGGLAAAGLRYNAAWRPFDGLHLPGAHMSALALTAGMHRDSSDVAPISVNSRYGRLAGALGAAALARTQASVFAIVGAGRAGSALTQTLVRMGASVVLIDPDKVELHNLDGDGLLPAQERMLKADALARALRPLLRPGAFVGARALDVGCATAGRLIEACDLVISAVDNDRARLRASLWHTALLKPHLDVGVAVLAGDIGADIRLALPGRCLDCMGGFARRATLAATADAAPRDGEFGVRRLGSLRTVGQTAAHL